MAYSIQIHNKEGKVVSSFDLNESLFADSLINKDLIHEYYLLQTSNARQNLAKVKWKGEIRGSGKKLYKQKGTWSWRVGMRQTPLRKWWGVAFGPRWDQNYTKTMTKKARKVALNSIVSLKAKAWELMGIQQFDIPTPKTKEAKTILTNLWLATKKVLFVISKKDEHLIKSFNNLPRVKYLYVDYLNPVDLMSYPTVLFLESTLSHLNK